MQKRKRTGMKFTQPSMTDQSFKDDCNINNVVDRHGRIDPEAIINRRQGQYTDASEVPQLQESLNAGIAEGQIMLQANPELQRLANNDPRQVEKVLADPENRELLIKAGIFNKPEPVPAVPAPAVQAPAVPAPAQP